MSIIFETFVHLPRIISGEVDFLLVCFTILFLGVAFDNKLVLLRWLLPETEVWIKFVEDGK
jgi:hypothetical protein